MPNRLHPRAPQASPSQGDSTAPRSSARSAEPVEHRNDVVIVGRLAAEAVARDLPSGDQVVQFRLIVQRDGAPVEGRPQLDTLDCAAWLARLRRSAMTWQPGDVIEARGALRRRFWRSPALNSRYEIEIATARRVAKAASTT